jgi:hypothetical protein
MNSSLLNIKTCFNLSNSPKDFIITDETDYAAQGIALSDVVGIITAKDPNGNIFYQNTNYLAPDVDADVSLDSSAIQLPLDLVGEVQKGNYDIIYSIQVAGTDVYSKEFSYDFNFDLPTASLDFTVNVNAAQVTSTDTTQYGQYLTSLTRLQTVKYPQSLNPAIADETSDLEVFIVGAPIYTKTWTSVLQSTVVFTLADGLCVTGVLNAVQDLEVQNNKSLCDSIDCIKALYTAWKEAQCNNPKEANRIEEKLIAVSALYVQVKEYEICGEVDKSQEACKKIVEIAASEGCECGCSDDDSEPQQILPLYGVGGAGGTTIVTSGGNGILVNAVTVGSTTTYTLLLDNGVLDSLGTSWISGTGVPASSLGNEGDYYIETDSALQNYYLKTDATTWTFQGTLTGAPGASVTSGITYDGANPLSCITFSATDLNTVITEIVDQVCLNKSDLERHNEAIGVNAAAIAALETDTDTNTSNINSNAEDIIKNADDLTQQRNESAIANKVWAGSGVVANDGSFSATPVGLNVTYDNGSGGASKGVDANGDAISIDSTVKVLTANADNYVDADKDAITVTPVVIGAAAPAIPAGNIRLYKHETNGSSVVSTSDLRRTSFVETDSISDASITGAKLEDLVSAKSDSEGIVDLNYDAKGRVTGITERSVQIQLTPAEIALLHTTPKLLASNVASRYLEVVSASFHYRHNGVAYNTGNTLRVKSRSSAVAQFQSTSTMMAQTSSQRGKLEAIPAADGTVQFISSDDLVLDSTGDLGSSGDGDLVINITYKALVPLI